MNDFWPLGISSHGKEEIWFVEMSANGHSILEQLGHKPRTPCKGDWGTRLQENPQ